MELPGRGVEPRWTRWPMTLDRPGHICFANVSLTMMVLSLSIPPAPSLLLKKRPSFNRMPIALKYSGDAARLRTTGSGSFGPRGGAFSGV
jgi:hypothetical protein